MHTQTVTVGAGSTESVNAHTQIQVLACIALILQSKNPSCSVVKAALKTGHNLALSPLRANTSVTGTQAQTPGSLQQLQWLPCKDWPRFYAPVRQQATSSCCCTWVQNNIWRQDCSYPTLLLTAAISSWLIFSHTHYLGTHTSSCSSAVKLKTAYQTALTQPKRTARQ